MSLRIYAVILEMVRDLRRFLPAIEAHDADLARQLRRATTSVGLNVAEAMGYIDPVVDSFVERQNQIIGTLMRLVRR